jgi:hypothetical protein
MMTLSSKSIALVDLYNEAVKASGYIHFTDGNPNQQYLEDLSLLGLERVDLSEDHWDHPIQKAQSHELDGWDGGFLKPNEIMQNHDLSDNQVRPYHWKMHGLGGSTEGHIVVIAPSTLQARIKAIIKTSSWLNQEREHWFEYWNKPSQEYAQVYREFWLQFFADLHQVPARNTFIIIQGAE